MWSMKRSSPPSHKFHYHVYVVLLENKVAQHPSVLRGNPHRDARKPCVYVGPGAHEAGTNGGNSNPAAGEFGAHAVG